MTRTIEALYEDGVLRPLEPLEGVAEHSRVRVTLELKEDRPHPLADLIGILPDEDAREMQQAIDEEFETMTSGLLQFASSEVFPSPLQTAISRNSKS